MFPINGANTVLLPSGRNGFQKKDKAAGISGTEITKEWLIDVQEEICNVLVAAGIVPAAATPTQLLEAIRAIAGIVPGASTDKAPRLVQIDATQNANISVPSSTSVVQTFPLLNYSSLGSSTWTTNKRLTVGAGEGGLWYAQTAWSFFTPASGVFAVGRIIKNGASTVLESANSYTQAGGGVIIQTSGIIALAPGDYIEAHMYHQAGSTQPAYFDGLGRTRFAAALIAAR